MNRSAALDSCTPDLANSLDCQLTKATPLSNPPPLVTHAQMAAAEARYVAPGLVEDAADGPVLIAGRCKTCGATSFPKAAVCTECLALGIETTHLGRTGVLYSFSVVHAAPTGWSVPYVLGYVDLADGTRVLAHIQGASDAIAIDAPVRLSTGRVGTGSAGEPLISYVFTPAGRAAP